MSSLPKNRQTTTNFNKQNDDITSKIKFNFQELEQTIEEEKDEKVIQENIENFKKKQTEEPDIQYPTLSSFEIVESFEEEEEKEMKQETKVEEELSETEKKIKQTIERRM